MAESQWWRHAVIYQVYPRSWADSDGDGIGDLAGVTQRLPHLVDLGVDAVWLSPFYTSPQRDGGYDVTDHTDVDPLFGSLADFDALIERAHGLGLRVIVDVVPNHSSIDHPWFQAALASEPGSAERARYLFRDGAAPPSAAPPNAAPPNNWTSVFGGPAWTQVPDGQWYLHLFDPSQADFDWSHPEVREHMESVLRFWLDRGVDGFRIDVAHGMVKAEGLPDTDLSLDPNHSDTALSPMWDQPGVHEIHRSWRTLVDTYSTATGTARILCAEAWVEPPEALARYVRPDELHQSFNFNFLQTPWNAEALRASITSSLDHAQAVGAPQTWVLSNHDVVRHATRLGRAGATDVVDTLGIGIGDPQPDAELGLRRARAATALMLALPGSAYLYQGEELGLPEATELPDEVREDPTWERSGHTVRGRDGCRVPVPWESGAPGLGFGPSGRTWLPQPATFGDLAPDRQHGVEGSTLELYRSLLRLRRQYHLGDGSLRWAAARPNLLQLDNGEVTVICNLGTDLAPLPPRATVIAVSAPLEGQHVPPDVTAWVLV
ncbi:glycoside hydrolase family 13 protein [Aeromicrobium sp. CF3.5]|uniref:glycoside hydrolase family 13 protein n=1 Tax=Aeromicrobium sp. CF3.5 TaxID=3373078 RepID=UPI003EE7A5C5